MWRRWIVIKHIYALITIILLLILIHILPFHSTNYIVLTPENWHKIINFNINDPRVYKLEVTLSARLVPYNHLTDYIGGLGIAVNKQLPLRGDFGMPVVVSKLFEDKENIFQEILKRALWYAPRYFEGSRGLSGERTIWFDGNNLQPGANELSLTSYDNNSGKFPSVGDGFIIKNIVIKAYYSETDAKKDIFILKK